MAKGPAMSAFRAKALVSIWIRSKSFLPRKIVPCEPQRRPASIHWQPQYEAGARGAPPTASPSGEKPERPSASISSIFSRAPHRRCDHCDDDRICAMRRVMGEVRDAPSAVLDITHGPNATDILPLS